MLQHVTRLTFYLVTGLLHVPQTAAWRRPASLPTLSLRILSLLSTYAQRQLPYRVAGVDSNDVLYAAEPSYASELRTLSAQVRHALLQTHLQEPVPVAWAAAYRPCCCRP